MLKKAQKLTNGRDSRMKWLAGAMKLIYERINLPPFYTLLIKQEILIHSPCVPFYQPYSPFRQSFQNPFISPPIFVPDKEAIDREAI
jgi:hypothetical protein